MDTTLPAFQMQNFYFPAIGIVAFALLHFYVYKALLKSLATTPLFKAFWLGFSVLNMLGCGLYFIFMHTGLGSQAAYFLMSLAVGMAFCLFIITLLYQVCSLAILAIEPKHKRARVRFWLKRAMGILALIFIIYGVVNGVQKPKVKEIEVQIAGLQNELKAVQLSDLHIGGIIESSRVKDIVERVNALEPDVIFLTGDIVDSKLANVVGAVDELRHLSARYGVYYVLGNHEYFHEVKEILQKMRDFGFIVLENDTHILQTESSQILIAGIRDLVGVRPAFSALELKPDVRGTLFQALEQSAGLDSHTPIILLSHQPKVIEELEFISLEEPELTKNIALILSGHTHGGQIFPFSLLVLLQQPHIKGLFDVENLPNTKLYINQGTGYWGPPMRVGSESEITLLHLKP
ncbi:metallophosphoesterase [Helicobacter sp. MIT 00-7814]|uniref:metallophosphoesterase n=1 Tax=unclassified Helicobacter TaxID=2593540 RepID=UPI000E1EAA0B|nr:MULTISPECIES: metallophosphoesterase [unclassified Helicobacter]RDU55481.1 metallophosphoesterase [Helicobacter sp. MIT 99-10781]RDU55570.1 metallophosphoesterase [Helicobacter sp. MIT 00-7814]